MSTRRPFVMPTDEAIRHALEAGPEVVAPADFAAGVGRAIARQPQRRGWVPFNAGDGSRTLRLVGQLLLLIALLLALVVGAIILGALRERGNPGEQLFIAQANALSVIDPRTGSLTTVFNEPSGIAGVARSTHGDLVSFWTGTEKNDLELLRADGTGRRRVATNITPTPVYAGGIDVWTADDRYLASGVTVDGRSRILVVDVATGDGSLIGPDDGADSPLWAPDGEWLVFAHDQPDRRTLAMTRRDGSGLREITGSLAARVSGPDNSSSDGTWIYFDAAAPGGSQHNVYRVNVHTGRSQQLTEGQPAAAPALAPDDSTVAFMVWVRTSNGQNSSVWVMTADGSNPRLLSQDSDLRGWSSDSHYVLVVVRHPDGSTQLVATTPDGRERRILLTLDSCPEPCLESLSWGWPRP